MVKWGNGWARAEDLSFYLYMNELQNPNNLAPFYRDVMRATWRLPSDTLVLFNPVNHHGDSVSTLGKPVSFDHALGTSDLRECAVATLPRSTWQPKSHIVLHGIGAGYHMN